MDGWICLHRSIAEHWIWSDPVKLKWWLDILLTVNHADAKVNVGMQLIDCRRGQTIMSLKNWSDRWGVSRDTVRNFLVLLRNDHMIDTENLTKTTRITVCKYDTYQSALHARQTRTKREPNADQTLADTNNNDNNDNNENKGDNSRFTPPLKFSFKQSLIDLGVDEAIATDWLTVRKKKKASNTKTAFEAIRREIELSGLPANECVKMAVERSWSGFNTKWIKNQQNNLYPNGSEKQQRADASAERKAAIMRMAAEACNTSAATGNVRGEQI